MIKINAEETRISQAKAIVAAAKEKCPDPLEFEALMADLLQSTLEHTWVDDEVESAIRKEWAELIGAEVVNEDLSWYE